MQFLLKICVFLMHYLSRQWADSSFDSCPISVKEGVEAPTSGWSLAGARGKNTKRVLARASNGWSQLARATMINFTQGCAK